MPINLPPTPTAAEIESITERCKAAIDANRDPMAVLTGEEHGTLIRLHLTNDTGAAILLAQLRDHAEHHPVEERRWSAARAVRTITFAAYVRGARAWHAEQNAAQRNANIISLAERRRTNEQNYRQRQRGPLAELNPERMVEDPSLRMRGIGLLIQRRGGRLWYDDFYKRVMVDWDGTADDRTVAVQSLDDEFILNCALWMAQTDVKLGNLSNLQVKACIETAANMDKRNAPRDWINSLEWDGVERLRDVMPRGFGAVNSAFNIAVGRCWFVGMVARVMRPGCQLDTMPVLIGPQGIFKSQALRVIGGDWYRSAISDIHSKDFKQELFGAMVFEIPELHSLVTSNAAAAKVKAVISNQVDHFRLPYGYTVGEFRRTAQMVGTTNNRDWHHDESGARRFWPIHCGEIDLDWIRSHRAQLFAEARVYFELPLIDGVRDPRSMWWNVPHDEQRAVMEHETAEDVWQGMIEGKLMGGTEALWINGIPADIRPHDGSLREAADWGNLLTTARIAYSWLALNSDLAGRRSTANRIGSIMRTLGWYRKQQRLPGNDQRTWIWTRPEDEDVSALVARPIMASSTEDGDDIPF